MKASDLLKIGRDVLRPSHSGDIVDWLEANVQSIPDSPMPGPFRAKRTPWIAQALRIAADDETRMLCILASIQSGKSLFGRLLTCHIIANAPGPAMFLMPNDAEAKDFSLRYLRPLWKNCPPVASRIKEDDLERSTTTDFDRMTLYCRGIWNESNLQRLSLRYTIADECWLAPPGHLAELSARVTAFGWMGKRIFMSQGGDANGEFDQLWQGTDCRDWGFRCPSCDALQPWVWEQIRWPDNAKSTGSWDYAKIAAGTTYECRCCGTRLADTNAVRLEANERGEFIPTKQSSMPGHIGLHWNSLASMSWGELSIMLLKSKESADLYGDDQPRRQFKQKRLALPWSDEGGTMINVGEAGNYDLADDWELEACISKQGRVVNRSDAQEDAVPFRTMGVDVGSGHFWVVIRSWAKTGLSRLRHFSRVETWEQLDDLAAKHKIHKALVMVDSGYASADVYREAGAKRGWKCTKGSGQSDFTVMELDGKPGKRFYSDRQRIFVPGYQRRAELIVFSNLVAKDILNGLRSKKLLQFARDTDPVYLEHMSAETRIFDRKSGKASWVLVQGRKDNHALDAEILAMLSAIRWGIVGRAEHKDAELNNETSQSN